jgi:hypothetical protein
MERVVINEVRRTSSMLGGLLLIAACCFLVLSLVARALVAVLWPTGASPERGDFALEAAPSIRLDTPSDDTAAAKANRVAATPGREPARPGERGISPLDGPPPVTTSEAGVSRTPSDPDDRPGRPKPPEPREPRKAPEPPDPPPEEPLVAVAATSVTSGEMVLAAHGHSGSAIVSVYVEDRGTGECDPNQRLRLPIRSSDESVATVSPSALTYTCTDAEPVTIHPVGAGIATIEVKEPRVDPADMAFELDGAAFEVQVVEDLPRNTEPTVTTPLEVTVPAENHDGATVAWVASATDAQDGTLEPICTPPSGSFFSIGDSTVSCAATDYGGLTDTATFDVHVVDPSNGSDPDDDGNGDGDGGDVDIEPPYAPTVDVPAPAFVDDRGMWFADKVAVSVSDNGDRPSENGSASGVDPSSYPQRMMISEPGRHVISGVTVRDRAGNESNPAPEVVVNIDADVPDVVFTCPDEVLVGEDAVATWTAADAGAGLSTPARGTIPLDTTEVGTFSVVAARTTAIDNVGHASLPARCEYAVLPGIPE